MTVLKSELKQDATAMKTSPVGCFGSKEQMEECVN